MANYVSFGGLVEIQAERLGIKNWSETCLQYTSDLRKVLKNWLLEKYEMETGEKLSSNAFILKGKKNKVQITVIGANPKHKDFETAADFMQKVFVAGRS